MTDATRHGTYFITCGLPHQCSAVWLLLCGEIGREKLVAQKLGVARSTVSAWAHGDNPIRLETAAIVEDALGYYPVTEFLAARMGRVEGIGNKSARACCAKA